MYDKIKLFILVMYSVLKRRTRYEQASKFEISSIRNDRLFCIVNIFAHHKSFLQRKKSMPGTEFSLEVDFFLDAVNLNMHYDNER